MTVTELKSTIIIKTVSWHWPRWRFSHPPIFLLLTAVIVAASALLPLTYLLVRASEAGATKVFNVLVRARTIEVFFNTLSPGWPW